MPFPRYRTQAALRALARGGGPAPAGGALLRSLPPPPCGQVPSCVPLSFLPPRSALLVLHKACEVARRHNYFPGGVALIWATYYESCISSEQSCINEWNAMQDLESTRPDSPALFVDK